MPEVRIHRLIWTVIGTACAVAASNANAWQFAVSGDSRNCGDVVMPAIAKDALKQGIHFYWHLGDFRAYYKIDEDLAHDPKYQKITELKDYRALAWKDFIENQVVPFNPVPVFLAIGNHELVDRTREDYISTFHQWLGSESGSSTAQTYYHWVEQGVDFITLDNASHEQFDAAQMTWFEKRMAQDEADPKIKTIVVGMHEALPDSISYGHSMSESGTPVAVDSGRRVYHQLLKARDHAHKKVYILASHSHFFMEGTFNTSYWKNNGGVLPGWIIGTAGAQRYPLPKDSAQAIQAETRVYGYLLATVSSDGAIRFDFRRTGKSDVPAAIVDRYGSKLVNFCFDQNVQ